MKDQEPSKWMTAEEFNQIRREAGLSVYQLGDIIRVHPRTIRKFVDGQAPVSGPISLLMELIDDGFFDDGEVVNGEA